MAWSLTLAAVALSGGFASAEDSCNTGLPEPAIYKFDQFPGSAVLAPEIAGAPNFREIGAEPVYGTAQPDAAVIPEILRRAGAERRRVLWINLREEPFLYINGRSYALRDPKQPFRNLAAVAHDAGEARRTETCLRDRLLAEAAANNGVVDLYDETQDGKLVSVPTRIESIQTVEEVFDAMDSAGFQVDFRRIPVEDEKAPGPQSLQALIDTFTAKPGEEPLVANCQGGKGRTTTALAILCIVQGGDPDACIDKVGAAHHLRDQIAKQKKPEKRDDYQARYDLLKALPGRLHPQSSPLPKVDIPTPDAVRFN